MSGTRSTSLLGVFLLLSKLAVFSDAVNYVNDELLWTKQSWDRYKLDFPWQHFAKREPVVGKLLESDAWMKTSLDGPVGDLKAAVDKDVKRGLDLQQSRFDVSLLDENASKDAAAGVAQCKVCMALASTMWRGLTNWVNVHEAVPSKKRMAEYGEQLCEYEVPNEVLSEWVLLHAKVQPSQMAPFFIEGNQEFYMLSERQKQHATPTEIAAVRLACKRLIKDDTAAASKNEIVRHASGLLHKYYDHLEQRLGKATRTGASVEAVDEGPQADDACIDRHPQCQKWADLGECQANPTYMIGDDKQYIGQCNRACKDCQSAKEEQPEWNDADAKWAASVSSDLLAVLHSKACAGGPPCMGATGAGMEQLLAVAGGKGKKAGTRAKGVGGFISGPVKSDEEGQLQQLEEERQVDPMRLQTSKVIVTREASDSFIPHWPPKKLRPSLPAKQLPTPAAKALWAELGNNCFYITTGWWMYELCFMDTITQFHTADNQKVDWVISLGKFESANWELRNTSEAGLYPQATQVPYVSQQFTNGNECELTEDTLDDYGDGEDKHGSGTVRSSSSGGGQGPREAPSGVADLAQVGTAAERGSETLETPQKRPAKGQQQQQPSTAVPPVGERVEGGVPVINRVSELQIMCSPDTELRLYVVELRQCRYRVELYVPQLCRIEGFQVEDHDLTPSATALGAKL